MPYVGFAPNWSAESSSLAQKFNSLQATVRKQLSYGVSFQAAYTFSRAFASSYVGNASASLANNVPVVQVYGLNANYRPHRFTVNYSWDLPFGSPSGLVGKLVNGWTLSGVTTIQNGLPLTVTDTRLGSIFGSPVTSNAQYASGMGRDNVSTSGSLFDRVKAGLALAPTVGGGYLNPAAFTNGTSASLPEYGNGQGYGNSGLGVVLGPGQHNWDMTLSKMTTVGGIREGATLQFRAEFFNIFNHAQFNTPGVALNAAATFGKITSASVNPRLIQFALKYAF